MRVVIIDRNNSTVIVDGKYKDIKTAVEKNKSHMRYADLSNLDLEHIDLSNSDFSHATFCNSNLKRTSYRASNLYMADFRNADLTGALLYYANMSRCYFSDTSGVDQDGINQLSMLYDQVGKIRMYMPTDNNKHDIAVGKKFINCDVYTLDHCVRRWWDADDKIYIVEFTAKDLLDITERMDGIVRVKKCTVVGEKNLDELNIYRIKK